MRERIADIRGMIGRAGARWAEVRLESQQQSAVRVRGRSLITCRTSFDTGGIVRVLARHGGFGVAAFSSPDDVEAGLKRALEAAAATDADDVQLHPVEAVEDAHTAFLKEDFRDVPLAHKRRLVSELSELMMAEDPRLKDSDVLYRDTFRGVVYVNSDGTALYDERPLVDLRVGVYALAGGEAQSASEGFGWVGGWELTHDREELARQAARRALRLLGAKRVPGGVYTVVTDPAMTGVFIHEAFGHLSEADHVHTNPQVLEMMHLGRRFGGPILNVSDYGTPEADRLMGNLRYDDEGVPAGRTVLIHEGRLVGRLHSRETAAKLGEKPTGNARAEDHRFAPLVRMTKTAVERGETPAADLFKGIKLGIYACGSRGGQTELGRYSFSAEEAFFIRDGKVAEPLRDVVLNGNIFDTLARVTHVGDDFALDSRGRCGKGGQSMPVSLGGPSLRIDGVVVGGESD